MLKRAITILIIVCIVSLPAMAYGRVDEVEIDGVVLEPKDPILSTVIAIGPGLLVHGFGHYVNEDYKMGLLLTGIELLSIGLMIYGGVENTTPDMFQIYGGNLDAVRRAGAVTFGVGFLLFVGSWLADIFLAGDSARQYNIEHNLEFKLQQETMGAGAEYALLYKYNF